MPRMMDVDSDAEIAPLWAYSTHPVSPATVDVARSCPVGCPVTPRVSVQIVPLGEGESGTYTITEVAKKLKCSTRHIHRLIAQKKMPGVLQVGKLLRFRKTIIDKWLT